jgi:hypothetical protein
MKARESGSNWQILDARLSQNQSFESGPIVTM